MIERFRRVLAYVDDHLDGDLSTERLAKVAAFSPFHFQRQFAAFFGTSAFRYVQLLRLRRAAHELAYRPERRTILEIALANGYESHEAFTRAFKRAVGQTPSEFREAPAFATIDELTRPLDDVRSRHMKPTYRNEDVTIVTFPRTPVAVLEHRGDPRTLGDTIRRFIAWRRANGLSPKVAATFNLLYGDPAEVPPEEFRLDLCTSLPRAITQSDPSVQLRDIPEGRCAKLRHTGTDATFGDAFQFLYGTWLPASGEEPRDFPLFLQRVSFGPDVPEHEAITDIFVPLV